MGYYTHPSTTFGGSFSRPTTLNLPAAYDPSRSYPLALILHTYGGTSADITSRVDFTSAGTFDDGLFVLAPQAIDHGSGTAYWNYWDTSAGLDFDFVINGLVLPAMAAFPSIDPRRVWIIGASNGALFASQIVLQYPTLFSAGFTLSGSCGVNDSTALAAKPIPWVEYHGELDSTIEYAGDPSGVLPGALNGHGGIGSTGYMSAANNVAAHATRNGLAGSLGTAYDTIHLMTTDATDVARQAYTDGATGTAVELWHSPSMNHAFTTVSGKGATEIYRWLAANYRRTR